MPGRVLDKKAKILYIEDNREKRMLVRAVLEAAGYTLVEAEEGLAGIEAAIREEPALILLDINLPGVEGREEGIYLRELNQRLVYRLLNQVEELKRLNQHFVRRASQLADLHRAVQDITSELGVAEMLERLLRALAQAIGTTSLRVELT